MLKVKCFGVAKEIVQGDMLQLDESIKTVKELRQMIHNRYPDFSSIKGFMIAINQEYATDDMQFNVNDELAIIPPVSGG